MSASTFGWTVIAVFLVVCLLWAYFGEAKPPRARPDGGWYGQYVTDWHRAHPGVWEAQEGQPGSWRKLGWGTTTLDWDSWWFGLHGMRLPHGAHEVPIEKDPPGVFRLTYPYEEQS